MSYSKSRIDRKENVVCVVDDDFYVRSLVRVAFSGIATVIEVESAEDALKKYKEHNPDILLLDIHMPKKGGKEVLVDILAEDGHAFVVMLSADSVPQNVISTNHSGAKGFIAKPFTKDTLLRYAHTCPTFTKSSQVA